MQNAMYLNAAGALAAETRMDVVANNIANVNTPGFRRGFAVFQKRLAEVFEPPTLEPSWNEVLNQQGGGLFVHEVTYTSRPGTYEQTSNPYDLAIDGDGWFSIGKGGETLYTRAGNFTRAADGTIVTADGQGQLLDDQGQPIQVPRGTISFGVDLDGNVVADSVRLARLEVRGQVDYKQYDPVGDSLYRYRGDGTPAAMASAIRQDTLERSSVNPVTEMVNLIRTHRAYEANQRMITQQDQSLGRAVNDVGRVGGR